MLPKCCGSRSEFGDTKKTTKTHDWGWARSNRGVVLTRKKCHNTDHNYITTSESHMSLESDSDMACASKRRCGTHWWLYPRYYRKQLLSRNKTKGSKKPSRKINRRRTSSEGSKQLPCQLKRSVKSIEASAAAFENIEPSQGTLSTGYNHQKFSHSNFPALHSSKPNTASHQPSSTKRKGVSQNISSLAVAESPKLIAQCPTVTCLKNQETHQDLT